MKAWVELFQSNPWACTLLMLAVACWGTFFYLARRRR